MKKKRNLSELRPMGDNPRIPLQAGKAGLRESLQEFGVEDGAPCFLQPLVINTHTDYLDRIIGGEQRWATARELGYEEIWVEETSEAADRMAELAVRLNVPAGRWDWELLIPFGGERLLSWGFPDLEFPAVAADPDVDLGGAPAPDVAAGALATAARLASPPDVQQQNRTVQFFFLEDDFVEFREILERLREAYGAATNSDAALQAFRVADAALEPEEP